MIVIVMILMPSPALARRSAAYTACVELHKVIMIMIMIMITIMILMMIMIHKIGELDDNMMPVGKESFLTKDMITITKVMMIVIK